MAESIVLTVLQWIITAALGAVAAFFGTRLKMRKKRDEEAKERDEALIAGMRNLLRHDIIQIHKEFIELGYCPIDMKEALDDSYRAYHALGGNGIITKIYQDVMELPEAPPSAA